MRNSEIVHNTLIVDELVDTGVTMKRYHNYSIAVLYRKDHTIIEPDYFASTINKWVIFPWEKKGVSNGKNL